MVYPPSPGWTKILIHPFTSNPSSFPHTSSPSAGQTLATLRTIRPTLFCNQLISSSSRPNVQNFQNFLKNLRFHWYSPPFAPCRCICRIQLCSSPFIGIYTTMIPTCCCNPFFLLSVVQEDPVRTSTGPSRDLTLWRNTDALSVESLAFFRLRVPKIC